MTVRRRNVGVLAAVGLLWVAAQVWSSALAAPAQGADDPWRRPPTFEAIGGSGWLMVTEATPGDPVHIGRWIVDKGELSVELGPTAVVGAGGGVLISDLDPGVWIVATESRVNWAVSVTEAGESDRLVDLMSFNIRYDNPSDDPDWGERLGPILTMLDERGPVVMGIQEGLGHQVEDLADGLPDYRWVGVGRDDGVEAGEFAAIFYRHGDVELVGHGTFWLSETPDVPSIGWDAVLPRIATWAELRWVKGGESFVVVNTHFDHVGAVARVESAALVAEKVAEIAAGKPSFVMGDLNVLPNSSALDPLLAFMDDSRMAAPVTDEVGSFNAFLVPGGLWSLDYVFVEGAEALSFETVDDNYGVSYISDHFPVVAKINCPACG